jgi:hypothetical protein
MSSSLCNGEGVRRSRSVPRGTVGAQRAERRDDRVRLQSFAIVEFDLGERDLAVGREDVGGGQRQFPQLLSPLMPGSALLFDVRAARSSWGSE